MGFIPIFLTMTGALVLFFLTVKNTLQQKVNFQKELLFKLKGLHPELTAVFGKKENPEELMAILQAEKIKNELSSEAKKLLKEMKINKHHFNQLIAKRPYKWIAKLSGFQAI